MTKENRERQYKHFRDLEHNYLALPGRDHDLERTEVVRANAKLQADAMLKKNPELEVKEEVKDNSKPEVKKNAKK